MTFFDYLNEKITILERRIHSLPQALDAAVKGIDQEKWETLVAVINNNANEVLDGLIFRKIDGAVDLHVIFDMGSGSFLPITPEIKDGWRKTRLPEVRVVISGGKILLMTVSELMELTLEPGDIILDWLQYKRLQDAIEKLIQH